MSDGDRRKPRERRREREREREPKRNKRGNVKTLARPRARRRCRRLRRRRRPACLSPAAPRDQTEQRQRPIHPRGRPADGEPRPPPPPPSHVMGLSDSPPSPLPPKVPVRPGTAKGTTHRRIDHRQAWIRLPRRPLPGRTERS